MGAMFPLVVRVWSSGGDAIARDVASVYTGNTVGSILGSWLPGFVLFALVGAERTLHLGVALNMILALLMLIAGAADPNEDQSWWSWRHVGAVGLPILAAVGLLLSVVTDGTRDAPWIARAVGAAGFVALAVAEYRWLRLADAVGRRPGAEFALVAALLPIGFGLGIAYAVQAPGEHPDWAVSAVYFALSLLVGGVGLVAGWINWSAWHDPEGAPTPGLSAAGAHHG
jgi:hypothetical protein